MFDFNLFVRHESKFGVRVVTYCKTRRFQIVNENGYGYRTGRIFALIRFLFFNSSCRFRYSSAKSSIFLFCRLLDSILVLRRIANSKTDMCLEIIIKTYFRKIIISDRIKSN